MLNIALFGPPGAGKGTQSEFLVKKYKEIRTSPDDSAGVRWVMGNLSRLAAGNIPLRELSEGIKF